MAHQLLFVQILNVGLDLYKRAIPSKGRMFFELKICVTGVAILVLIVLASHRLLCSTGNMMTGNELVHVPSASSTAMVPEQVPVSQLAKWGDAGRAGFQVIPNVLFRAQKHLGVDCVDILILLNLSLHWWGPYSLPYPSPALIAERMNVSKRTIERRLQTLEKSGFIKRLPAKAPQEGKPKVRSFEMSGLVAKLEEAALVGLVQREYRRREG